MINCRYSSIVVFDLVTCTLCRRRMASERARRPCCGGAALQLAGGGAGYAAAEACSGSPELVLGGCRWPRATRAPGPRRGVSRGSRRSSGAAAAARLQRASRARWRLIGHLRFWGEAHATRDGKWAPWEVAPAVLRLCVCCLVCLVPGGGRTVCQGGSLLYKKMSAALI